MKKFHALSVLLVILLLADGVMAEDPCSPYTDPVCGEATGNYWCQLSDFRGVPAFSNGAWTGNGNCGEFQCVEFVRRVYRDEIDNTLGSLGSNGWAVEAFDAWSSNSGLNQYANGQTTNPPEPGDIYCQSGNTIATKFGHIAIIKSVDLGAGQVIIIDQNRDQYSAELTRSLEIDEQGMYRIQSIGDNYTTQGWLRDPDYDPQVFSCSFVSQSITPIGPFLPGRQVTCMVKFKNEGNVTWQKIPGTQYVELASTNIDEEIVNSFFNDPLESGLGWLNQFAPCTFTETEVPPSGIATFNFTGRVRLNAKPGHYKIYFGPVHNGEILLGWSEMHFPIDVDAGWISSTPANNCVGNVDGQGYSWDRPEFIAGAPQWIMETIPDGSWGCGNCDRYYRYWYQHDGIQNGSGVAIKLFSDDGCELWVNGIRIGGYGNGTCHQAGCVNGGGGGCGSNDNYAPVDITNYLNQGINLIAVHVSQGPGGAYFNCQFSNPPLDPSMPGVCCTGINCTQINESFTWADCLAAQGEMFAGGQYDCQTIPPCQNTNMCVGDPVLTFKTTLPVPVVPASLTFNLVDSIPYSAWYALPPVLGGDTIHMNNFTGGFTVGAQQSIHPDTVDLLITNYYFEAPSVLINGIPTGINTILLDSSLSPARHGTFNRVSRQVSLVIPSVLTNDLFSSSNPVHSRSQILGSFNEVTGVLTTASESVSLLPPCCEGNRGDLNGDGNDCNILDLTFLVNFIFRGSGNPGSCSLESDVNGDGSTTPNILDLTFAVNRLFRGGPPPPACP